ncbi:xanthine dehydrogenase family protein molybdopterin-binding subunit [Marinovum sp.]|uniref:xanthine dehydrogenase family protein molybdopterin-binding subunit n=1 Tax=Marinovum sp. TaxID=2024839 RepID=UPI003A8D18B8
MEKFGKSQPVTRVEDLRFLTGEGRYVDDIAPENALHGVVFRSPVAHAEITTLDVEEARQAPGVHLVVTLADLEAAGVKATLHGTVVTNIDGSKGASPERPVLARDRVRFVGEPVAMVFAETLQQARDAAELIEFEYDDLPVSLALEEGPHTIHPEAPGNLAYHYGKGDAEATDAAFAKAAHVVSLQVEDNRIIVNSLEPRGCFAEPEGERLHVAINGQGVWGFKQTIARALGLDAASVRITNPDVGGGFGMKAPDYPEYVVCAYAARALDRPVRWMAERTESMLSDNAGRDLTTLAEMAFDADHRILGYRLTTRNNLGAYNSGFGQPIQTELFSKVLMGTYDVQAAYMSVKGFYTNTVQVDAYRGAGRPEAIYVLERLMDRAARELGTDGWELRRRNFIPAAKFPYQTVTGELYDVGDFDRVLSHAEASSDRAGFAARRQEASARGKLRGIGLCYYIESILGDPSEGAKVTFDADGGVSLYVGTQSNGQGHETVYAHFLADQTGIPMDRIRVVQGDSDLIARGGGTGGSRSVTVQANVTLTVVARAVAAFTPFLADMMGVEEKAVRFDNETFRADGSNLTPTLLEAAQIAREAGRDDLLSHEARDKLPGRSYPNGAHVAEVEVDPETGEVTVERYTVVDDFGNLINPLLAEGQVHGGVAQGIGQALTEHVVHDEDGQLLTATFMDYGMPRADILPMFRFETEPVPSTANPMGMKGCGEAGTVGAMAAMGNAVQDALWDRGVRQADMPFTPMRVWSMLRNASKTAA